MGANHGTLAALDAGLRVPYRNLECKIALLPLCGSGGERAVAGEGADRQLISPAFVDRAQHFALKFGRLRREGKRHLDRAADLLRHFHLEQVRQSFIHRLHVLLDDFLALAAVGIANRLADRLHRFLAG